MADYRTIFILKDAEGGCVEFTEDQLNTWLQDKVSIAQHCQHIGVRVMCLFRDLERDGHITAYGHDITRMRLVAEYCPVCGEFCESDVDNGTVYKGIACRHSAQVNHN